MPESATLTPAFAGLRALAGCGGCAAKAPPEMVSMLAGVAATVGGLAPEVLVGLNPADDAAVYALDAQRALVATVDFFPPVVDDADDYGAVAAANAVSDIYAMGGTVAFALSVCGFPDSVPPQIVAAVNRAAAELVRACGGVLIGGHSVRCAEPLFGLCVLGFVHPGEIWRKAGAQLGDKLLLSKPIGTGLLLSSRRPEAESIAVASMRVSNQAAAAALHALPGPPHAVTDVSGYGLLGHVLEMAQASGVRLSIDAPSVPLLAGALDAARWGVRTSAHVTNVRQAAPALAVSMAASVDEPMRALLHDPQTSGGLLVAVDAQDAARLSSAGFTCVGEVLDGPACVVVS